MTIPSPLCLGNIELMFECCNDHMSHDLRGINSAASWVQSHGRSASVNASVNVAVLSVVLSVKCWSLGCSYSSVIVIIRLIM